MQIQAVLYLSSVTYTNTFHRTQQLILKNLRLVDGIGIMMLGSTAGVTPKASVNLLTLDLLEEPSWFSKDGSEACSTREIFVAQTL